MISHKLSTLESIAKIAAQCGDVKFKRSDVVRAGVKGSEIQNLKRLGFLSTDEDNRLFMCLTEYAYRQLTQVEKLASYIAKNVA